MFSLRNEFMTIKALFNKLLKGWRQSEVANSSTNQESVGRERALKNIRDALVCFLNPDYAEVNNSGLRERWLRTVELYDIAKSLESEKSRIYLGVYGSPKMGKSTLLNSLVGEEILPEAPIPKTGSVIDLIHDEKSTVYQLFCKYEGSGSYMECVDSTEKVCEILNSRAGQEKPCEQVKVKGAFTAALPVIKRHMFVLRDTPGAEAEMENIVNEQLKKDSRKADRSLEETHIPIFCVSSQTLQDKSHKMLFDRYFRDRGGIYVITRCDDRDGHEHIRNLFSRHFGISQEENYNLIVCTGMSNIEAKKVDVGLDKLCETIEKYINKDCLEQRIVNIAKMISDDDYFSSLKDEFHWPLSKTQKSIIDSNLKYIN